MSDTRARGEALRDELARVEALGRSANPPGYAGPLPTVHRPEERLRQARAHFRREAWLAEMIYLVAVALRDRRGRVHPG